MHVPCPRVLDGEAEAGIAAARVVGGAIGPVRPHGGVAPRIILVTKCVSGREFARLAPNRKADQLVGATLRVYMLCAMAKLSSGERDCPSVRSRSSRSAV